MKSPVDHGNAGGGTAGSRFPNAATDRMVPPPVTRVPIRRGGRPACRARRPRAKLRLSARERPDSTHVVRSGTERRVRCQTHSETRNGTTLGRLLPAARSGQQSSRPRSIPTPPPHPGFNTPPPHPRSSSSPGAPGRQGGLCWVVAPPLGHHRAAADIEDQPGDAGGGVGITSSECLPRTWRVRLPSGCASCGGGPAGRS